MYAEQPPASTQWRGRAGGAACSISSSIRSPSCCGGRGALAGHRRARALRRDCRGHRAQRRVRVRAGAPGRARHGGVARPAAPTPACGAGARCWRSTRRRWSRGICCCWPRATACPRSMPASSAWRRSTRVAVARPAGGRAGGRRILRRAAARGLVARDATGAGAPLLHAYLVATTMSFPASRPARSAPRSPHAPAARRCARSASSPTRRCSAASPSSSSSRRLSDLPAAAAGGVPHRRPRRSELALLATFPVLDGAATSCAAPGGARTPTQRKMTDDLGSPVRPGPLLAQAARRRSIARDSSPAARSSRATARRIKRETCIGDRPSSSPISR